MIRRMIRQAGAFTIASFAWKHRGTVMRAVDLLRRTPELVSSGRTEDLTTEARAVAALDGPFGAATDVRITGVDDGNVMLRDSLAGPALDAARGVLRSVDPVLDVRTGAGDHPNPADAPPDTGGGEG